MILSSNNLLEGKVVDDETCGGVGREINFHFVILQIAKRCSALNYIFREIAYLDTTKIRLFENRFIQGVRCTMIEIGVEIDSGNCCTILLLPYTDDDDIGVLFKTAQNSRVLFLCIGFRSGGDSSLFLCALPSPSSPPSF